MRYTKEHKVRTRGRIVERASLALREEGADGVSVAALMDLAGLTHGGFYAHFESREALVVEAVLMAMDQTMSRWLQLVETTPVADRFNAIVDTYINAQDRDNRGRVAHCRPWERTLRVQAKRLVVRSPKSFKR